MGSTFFRSQLRIKGQQRAIRRRLSLAPLSKASQFPNLRRCSCLHWGCRGPSRHCPGKSPALVGERPRPFPARGACCSIQPVSSFHAALTAPPTRDLHTSLPPVCGRRSSAAVSPYPGICLSATEQAHTQCRPLSWPRRIERALTPTWANRAQVASTAMPVRYRRSKTPRPKSPLTQVKALSPSRCNVR